MGYVKLYIWSSYSSLFMHTLPSQNWQCVTSSHAASLAVPPTVENAKVSVVVSADSRRATATYSCTGIYTISGSQTLTFDCNVAPHMWNPTFTLCTGTYKICS